MDHKEEIEKLLNELENNDSSGVLAISAKEYKALIRVAYKMSALAADAEREADEQRTKRWAVESKLSEAEEELERFRNQNKEG